MKLANNIVRVNGYLNGKRTHADFEVPMVALNIKGRERLMIPDYDDDRMVDKAFKSGKLDTVTSVNAWNWVGNHRLTTRIW